jgi:hypothetical protein
MSAKLPAAISEQILSFGEYSMGVNKVALRLKDGAIIEDVFVAWGKEVVRVGGVDGCPFDPAQVVEVYDRPRSRGRS